MPRKDSPHPIDGFTLIELMIVVAIIGILAAIAIPKFSQLISKSQESTTKGNLGSIRGALSIYYSETEGDYPMDDLAIFAQNHTYLPEFPGALLPKTTNSIGHGGPFVSVRTGVIPGGSDDAATNAGWLYDNTGATSTTWGKIVVNCTHLDIKGSPWTSS